jgi:pimeloyl-ACP methyl ester carboxylesterase
MYHLVSLRRLFFARADTPPPDLPAQVPKLIIHPTYDSTALPDMMDKSASLPGAELVKIEKAGHWVLQTHPEEVEKLVGDWLDRVVGEAKL